LPQVWVAAAVFVLLLAALWFFPEWGQDDLAPVAQTQEKTPANAPGAADSSLAGSGGDVAAETYSHTHSAPEPARSVERPSPVPAESVDAVAMEESEMAAVQEEALSDPAPAPNAGPAIAKTEDAAAGKAAADIKKDQVVETVPGRAMESAKAKKPATPSRTADSVWHATDLKPDMGAEKKAARDEAQPKESEPEGGWDVFGDYLRQNARLTTEARNHNVSGTVQIRFNINENGDPQGFTVLRSLGYGCDQEAVRLVRNWEWKRGQNPVVTVEVPFVR
jgi:protein TonB